MGRKRARQAYRILEFRWFLNPLPRACRVAKDEEQRVYGGGAIACALTYGEVGKTQSPVS